jgi:ADP-ribose pyrophosphatase YjhB (NUDIX family)
MTTGTTRVAAYCVCLDGDERLLLTRLNDITTRPGAWTLPGGGLEFGEHPEAGAVRELREETGLEGQIVELLAVDSFHRADTVIHRGEPFGPHHGIRIVYRVEIVGGELRHELPGNSSDMAAWFGRRELASLDLVDVAQLGTRLAYGESPRRRPR